MTLPNLNRALKLSVHSGQMPFTAEDISRKIRSFLAGLRYAQADFDALFSGRNSLPPLESVVFLAERQRLLVLT